jgi:hypothetical protein
LDGLYEKPVLEMFILRARIPAQRMCENPCDPTAEPLAVADQASLMAALDFAGATVGARESVSQVFFTLQGSMI